jgi:lipopolysaccharide transport system ATP-binding protein
MQSAIKVDHLSKRYRLGAELRDDYRTLRETIMSAAAAPWRRLLGRTTQGRRTSDCSDAENSASGHFWALKDLSFEVEPGEVVGIIGRNGAGKSTLLKILSRITEPTSGRAEFTGRIGSLLEVGTGFHPELTGRENIYLNGSILGMFRREIDRKFEEIVAFAEIERFLDTPVKRYSSGMYVRLAFAVAAHLQPEILLVDEVLAVGDAQFQKKCLGKMETIARGGRTVLFVSHQMSAVQRLCRQCLLLDKGRLESFGPKNDIIAQYLSKSAQRDQPGDWIDLAGPRKASREARFMGLRFRCPHDRMAHHPYPDGPLEIEVVIESNAPRRVDGLAITFSDRYGTKLVNADSVILGQPVWLDRGTTRFLVEIEQLHLNPDTYILGLWLANNNLIYDGINDAAEIEVVDPPTEILGIRPPKDGKVTCSFSITKRDSS